MEFTNLKTNYLLMNSNTKNRIVKNHPLNPLFKAVTSLHFPGWTDTNKKADTNETL